MRFCSFRIYRLIPALLFALSFAVAGEPSLPEVQAPWMKGERLEFDLCWGPITAGFASLEVKPVKDGKTEFLTFATGNKTINKIYPVNDTIYTRVRNKGLMTEVFRKRLHEGTFHNTSVIRFDRKGEKAWLSDTVFTDMKTRKVKRSADTAVTIKGMEHSIMSAFYYVRTMQDFGPRKGQDGQGRARSGRGRHFQLQGPHLHLAHGRRPPDSGADAVRNCPREYQGEADEGQIVPFSVNFTIKKRIKTG